MNVNDLKEKLTTLGEMIVAGFLFVILAIPYVVWVRIKWMYKKSKEERVIWRKKIDVVEKT